MEPISAHQFDDVDAATRIPAPVAIVDELRRMTAVDHRDLDLREEDVVVPVRIIDDEIEVSLFNLAPGARTRFVEDRHGRAHAQYWTRQEDGTPFLQCDWPVNLDDIETTARTIWYLIVQTHYATR
ncbi:hypothetical protein GS481_02870 [Rhodococcus hoagii]|nr:hypothetical protein [Prescottella equi]